MVHEAHARLKQMLQKEGARIDAVYYCPHHPTAGDSRYTASCDCRKPGTGMIDQASHEYDVDSSKSFMIGDKWIDVELGQRAGVRTILVKTGYAPDDPGNLRPDNLKEPDFIADTLTEAVEWIIQQVALTKQ